MKFYGIFIFQYRPKGHRYIINDKTVTFYLKSVSTLIVIVIDFWEPLPSQQQRQQKKSVAFKTPQKFAYQKIKKRLILKIFIHTIMGTTLLIFT
jgi:hypothetical protein